MAKQYGFTIEAKSFESPKVYDIETKTLISLPTPVRFDNGAIHVPVRSDNPKISLLPKSIWSKYGFLTTSLVISDPENDPPIDVITWLDQQGMQGKVSIFTGFEKAGSTRRCFVDIIFNNIDDALKFKSTFGDYGIKKVEV